MFDRTRRLRLLLAVLVVASLTIITLDFRAKSDGPLDGVGRAALSVLGPLQRGLVTIFRPLGNFAAGFTKVPSLRERIARLEQENAQLRLAQEQVEDIERENASLRRQLALRDRYGLRTLTAPVIGVGPSNFERTVIVGRGSNDGVRKDMPVIAGEGLAGRVVKVGASTAEVVLLIDRSSAVAGRVAASGETGFVRGTGSSRLRFELFDPEASVAIGDKVVTSGYDRGLYPPGLPIGTVTEAPPAGSNLTRNVAVEPFVDFSSLDYVLIVTGATR
jgi:rod shape-determining protein MreC